MDFADIQNKKLELIHWLSSLDNISIINKIIELRNQDNTDWWHSLSESEIQSLQKGISDADAGRLKPHTEARKLYEKWL